MRVLYVTVNVILPFRVSSKENRVNVDITNLLQNFSFSMIKYTPDKRAKELISRPLFKSNSDSATYYSNEHVLIPCRESWFCCVDIAGKHRILRVFLTEKHRFKLNMKR